MKILKKLLIIVFFVLCTAPTMKADTTWTRITDVYLVNKTNYSFQRGFLLEKWGTKGSTRDHWTKKGGSIVRGGSIEGVYREASVQIPQNRRVKIFSISRETVGGEAAGFRTAVCEVTSKDAPYKLKITADYNRGFLGLFPHSFKIKLIPILNNPKIKASYRFVRAKKVLTQAGRRKVHYLGKWFKDVEVTLEQVKE